METNVISLPFISGVERTPVDLVCRDSFINLIQKTAEQADIVFVDGSEGVGKSTVLQDFVWQNPFKAISHFIDSNYNYTYSYDNVLDNIYTQIYFYCYNKEFESDINVNATLFNAISGTLFRKIKQKRETLYFVFDGFESLEKEQLEKLVSIFDSLPWGKAKFIVTGTKEHLDVILGTKKIKSKEITLSNFSLNETKAYFKGLCEDDNLIHELHKLGDTGHPGKLKELKLNCIESGGVEEFLNSEDISTKTDFLELLWKKIDETDQVAIDILSILAFNDVQLESYLIAEILKIDEKSLERKVKSIPFLELVENVIKFQTETFRKLAVRKLNSKKEKVNSLLIEYYESNPTREDSVYNLPSLYKKAERWEKLTKFYSVDAFIHIMEKHQSMGNVNSHFSQGFEASKKSANKFNEAFLRFSLHKSSIKELERHELWENEIEARIVLNDYEQALILANSALLKEDRLKLLSILAKQRKLRSLAEDSNLIEQIRTLYEQIDFSKIRKKGFEIAGLLIYSCFDLAIDLVEKISDNTASKNSLDYAFAYLTIYANEANKKSKTQVADIDVINAKIQSIEVKNITKALSFLSDEYGVSEIIENVEGLTNFSQKLFLLKSWIFNNTNNNEVGRIIKYTLDEIVKTSIENVPNATSLAEIATPLPNIKSQSEVEQLVLLFDAQRTTIDRPTKDYIKLQLLIAESLLSFDKAKANDRIFDIFLFIDELNDLSIKTDCLCMLWVWLSRVDSDGLIEKSISSGETIENQVRKNIDLLLYDTAYHFKMVEYIVKIAVVEKPDFVLDIISKLNTQIRKEVCYKLAIVHYIQAKNIDDIDFNIIDSFYEKETDLIYREEIIIEIIEKLLIDKTKIEENISYLFKYYDKILQINNVENKCYAITHTVQVLSFDKEQYSNQINTLLSELYKSWEDIDVLWNKIEIGFLIARDIAEYSREEALKYLELSTELKNKEPFSSRSIINTYIGSTKLCIRAFSGLVLVRENVNDELAKLSEIINHVQSIGEKAKLWSELALRIHSFGKVELFSKIYKEYIGPILFGWTNDSFSYHQIQTLTQIAPVLYLHNNNVFIQDYFSRLPQDFQNLSLSNICNYKLTKLLSEDPVNTNKRPIKLEYSELKDVAVLIGLMSDDILIYNYIEKLVSSIRENRNDLSLIHKNSLKQLIKSIIDEKLPTSTGIQHDGYSIISEAVLLTLEQYNPNSWDILIEKARLIPNLSDRALILVILADKINVSSKKKKIEIMEEAFNLTKAIPSIYDKTNRFDSSWETWLDIDKGKFSQHIKLAYQDLLQSKDGEVIGLRNLIDVAQQHDPKMADSFITMLDQDDARRKLKEPLLKRLENNNKIKTARSQYDTLSKLSTAQFSRVFYKNLEELNSGRLVPKNIEETSEVIEKASTITFTDSYEAYLYFIQNAVKKFESNRKDPDVLTSIYAATIENTKLIAILSLDNISKMKNLYNVGIKPSIIKSPIISPGDRELAIGHIRTWLSCNVNDKMFIIDPYFTEKDLEILLHIKELNPASQVTILTSKMSKNNSHHDLENVNKSTNKDVYMRAWEKLSSEPPVDARIKVVWDRDTKQCPFHDRWYVAGEAQSCLYIGTSYNGLGNRDSQIIHLEEESALSDVKDLIDTYIYKEESRIENYNLKYERFDLEQD